MKKEKSIKISSEEMPDGMVKELSLLYGIGVNIEELDYLITLKMNEKAL